MPRVPGSGFMRAKQCLFALSAKNISSQFPSNMLFSKTESNDTLLLVFCDVGCSAGFDYGYFISVMLSVSLVGCLMCFEQKRMLT